MTLNENFENLVSVHAESCGQKRGLIKTTIEREYYLDRATGQVTLRETVTVENPYPNARKAIDKKVIREIVPSSLVPDKVRKRVMALMKTT